MPCQLFGSLNTCHSLSDLPFFSYSQNRFNGAFRSKKGAYSAAALRNSTEFKGFVEDCLVNDPATIQDKLQEIEALDLFMSCTDPSEENLLTLVISFYHLKKVHRRHIHIV